MTGFESAIPWILLAMGMAAILAIHYLLRMVPVLCLFMVGGICVILVYVLIILGVGTELVFAGGFDAAPQRETPWGAIGSIAAAVTAAVGALGLWLRWK